ncbi:hypothetical protein LTR54_017332 [Friedmanniomyces endolithicus]|nr:hypothetical protein LTR54_017332 [Friedmanniomyces endolithicus]
MATRMLHHQALSSTAAKIDDATLDSNADLIEKRRGYRPYTVFIVCFMCLGSASFGYAASIIATTLGQPSFVEYMALGTASNAHALISAMVSLFYVGGIAGAVCHGWISNAYGRKRSIIVGNIIILIAGALTTAAVNPAMFIVFRFVTGWGAFQSLSSVPLWVSEIVPPRDRGRLVDIHAVLLNLGYTLAGYVGAALKRRGRSSTDSIQDPSDAFVKREFYQMRKQLELDATLKASYLEIFRHPSYRKRALMTMYLFFSLVSSGVLVINSYGALLYSELGYDATGVLLLQAGWTLSGLAMNAVAMSFADKIPRPYLISLGFALCTMTLIITAALQKSYLNTADKGGLSATAAMLFLFFIFYSLTLDGARFTVAIVTLCVVNLAWVEAAPYAFASLGWKFYLFFIVLSALASIVSFLYFPDTLHKPLEEIALLFGDEDRVVVVQRQLAGADLDTKVANDEATRIENLNS